MKKLISIFAAVALVGSLAAAPRKPVAPAKPVAPVVTAPTAPAAVSSMAKAASNIGLTFGLSVGYVTDMFKQGDKLKTIAGAAGGGAISKTVSNANSSTTTGNTSNCSGLAGVGLTGSDTASCSASGDGSNVSLNGIDIGLKVQYDILPWLFVRSGFHYVIGMKNTYTASITRNGMATGTQVDSSTLTVNGSIMEIPGLLGFNLINNDKGTIYFAAGINYSIGQYDQTLSATQSVTIGTATTFTDVTNTTKQSGLGIMWLVGGKVAVTSGVSLFGEVKFLSAAAAKADAVTGTAALANNNQPTTTTRHATSAPLTTGYFTAANGAPSLIQNGTAVGANTNFSPTNASGAGGLDLSYTRWQVGVQYEL